MADDHSDFYNAIDWSRLKPGKGDDWATTMAVGEEGEPDPYPGEVTTMACGEEGNDCGDPIEVTTMAIGEEGDPWPIEPEPIMTTMALGEEGDDPYDIFM
jgi:hypothetical protein